MNRKKVVGEGKVNVQDAAGGKIYGCRSQLRLTTGCSLSTSYSLNTVFTLSHFDCTALALKECLLEGHFAQLYEAFHCEVEFPTSPVSKMGDRLTQLQDAVDQVNIPSLVYPLE